MGGTTAFDTGTERCTTSCRSSFSSFFPPSPPFSDIGAPRFFAAGTTSNGPNGFLRTKSLSSNNQKKQKTKHGNVVQAIKRNTRNGQTKTRPPKVSSAIICGSVQSFAGNSGKPLVPGRTRPARQPGCRSAT